MKVKVIKRAELESLGETQEPAPKTPRRRRIKAKVEKWVTEIRKNSEAESRVTFDQLFQDGSEPST